MNFKELITRQPTLFDTITAFFYKNGSRTLLIGVRLLQLIGQAYKEDRGHELTLYVAENLSEEEKKLLAGSYFDDIVLQFAGALLALKKQINRPPGGLEG